ncbi:uncharacterized protein C8Q71DRAFT_862394 [Rhodofomes roseus]|uniref:F-box domain-containing protein n=1 Tax=Rhodofomes roseus TaxID=34475 RepID=A0ABQ8K2D0_9APHY|nr:uncharacterized protein C8Q71DRAFT_862394 [Rhodofomes roseus]KAH9830643.1 hypothetical protein C8Q71DRAFT_862394 [Rhodofomes roseus]
MDDPMNKTDRVENHTSDPESIPEKLTDEEPQKEEKDSRVESERVRVRIRIRFRQPIYASDTGPQFPQELIERICEYLWDEPLILLDCMRVCRAWYHAARRLLSRPWMTWRNREALQDDAHTLISHRNAPYRKHFKDLSIYDDASNPFAHVWPMFIPGSMLPKVRSVELVGLDWSTKTPHDSFFVYLSSYTSVWSLDLRDCRFRSLTDLRRVINALPNLTSLGLHNVTLQHPLRPGSVPDYIALRARSHKLESIDLYSPAPEHPDVPSDYLVGTTALNCRALTHMAAANSSTVTDLTLDLRFFTSLSALRQCLAHFCCLTSFQARYQFTSKPSMVTFEETIPAHTEITPIHSWSRFTLTDVPDQSALQLLQLLLTNPESCSKLQDFQVYLAGRPSAALLSCTSRALHASGHRLRNLTWQCSVDPDLQYTPSIAGNTSLQGLRIVLRDVAPSPQKIHSALTAVLSDIVSVDLQHMYILFTLLEVLPQNHGRAPAVLDPAESISAFHTILLRKIFRALPLFTSNDTGVQIAFYVQKLRDNPTVVAAIKAYVVTLFTPWLDRGIVQLSFFSGFDASDTITCVPTSELREDISSDSRGEDIEEDKPVGAKQ